MVALVLADEVLRKFGAIPRELSAQRRITSKLRTHTGRTEVAPLRIRPRRR
jgi:hypothetical protein